MPRKLAEKRAFVPRKNRMVYVFNAKGEQVDYGASKEMDEKYNLGGQMRVYIAKQRIKDRQYYFSLSSTIKIREHKYSFNPEIRKKFDAEKENKRRQKQDNKKYDINFKPPALI